MRHLLIFLLSCATASFGSTSTRATELHPLVQVDIIGCEHMSSFAHHPSFTGKERAALDVNDVLNGFQVVWVDTVSNSALVVNLKSVQYGANEHHVRGPVSMDLFAFVKTDTVPLLRCVAGPEPTNGSLVDLLPKHFVHAHLGTFGVVTGSVAVLRITFPTNDLFTAGSTSIHSHLQSMTSSEVIGGASHWRRVFGSWELPAFLSPGEILTLKGELGWLQ